MILDFIKQLLPSLEKRDIIEDLKITESEFDNGLVDIWKAAAEHFTANKVISSEVKDLSTVFYREYNADGRVEKNFILEIATRLSMIRKNIDILEEELKETLEKITFTDQMDVKKAGLIKMANYVNFISRFSLDLLLYVYAKEAEAAGASSDLGKLTKIKEESVKRWMGNYAILVSSYSVDSDRFKLKVRNIPDVRLNDTNYEAIMATYKHDAVDPFASDVMANFDGSPIYRLRMVFAEWQSNRYKAYEEKKRALELRLFNLKQMQMQGGKKDPVTEKEILITQERVDDLDYKLKQMEEDVGL